MNNPIRKPLHLKGKRLVLTKSMIQNAQSNTQSARQAAKWLGVTYNTYKKWAKYYGIFEQHLNQSGVGIKKGWATYKIKLDDILTGKRESRYSVATLKKRLIDEGYFQEECSHCGYNEVNLGNDKVCLNLDFIDGEIKNCKHENLRLLCPNCYLSFNGHFPKSKLFCK